MQEIFTQYWWLFLVALLIGFAVAWWVLVASRRTRVEIDKRDALDEDAAPTQRNQALIDSAPAAGELSSAANSQKVAHASAAADAEAGPAIAPTRSFTNADKVDDLTRIKGVGPKLQALLHDLGVTSFAQVAAWDDAEIDRVDAKLGRFEGRIRRDDWVEQARLLDSGDMDGYTRRFGAG